MASERDIKRGILAAEDHGRGRTLIFFEVFIVAGTLGAVTENWYVFGGALIALFVMFAIKPLAIILALLFSFYWAISAGTIVAAFAIGSESISSNWYGGVVATFQSVPSIIVALFVFLCVLGLHLAAID